MRSISSVLEKLRKDVHDAQCAKMSEIHMEANKHYYTVGYGDGMQAALLLIQNAIRKEKEDEMLDESARWGY